MFIFNAAQEQTIAEIASIRAIPDDQSQLFPKGFMKLTNKEKAYVPISKLLEYLLSETHPIGKTKSKYLRSVGFNETNVGLLKQGLINIAQSEDILEVISSPHGVKYIINGSIKTPAGNFIKNANGLDY